MRVRSEVWAAVTSRLDDLLASLVNCDLDLTTPEPDTDPQMTLRALEGLALILHLAGLCYTHTRYLTHTQKVTHPTSSLTQIFPSLSLSSSSSSLLWLSASTLGRALETCQSLLGGAKSTTDHAHIQSAIQVAVRILDSIIYLTSKNTHTQAHTCIHKLL